MGREGGRKKERKERKEEEERISQKEGRIISRTAMFRLYTHI
jgi:hypothetical protein